MTRRIVARYRNARSRLAAFAATALLLGAVGLPASIAWWVAQRSREIGVRMALGASTQEIVSIFLKQGLLLALGGIALGLAGAAAAHLTLTIRRYLRYSEGRPTNGSR
ncbi:MAG TPA: FtsX-like permease family protein [Vicinamibacterales bacterium]|nr:FtsX-like permease family protein [Vicinamibacterales bacterium]